MSGVRRRYTVHFVGGWPNDDVAARPDTLAVVEPKGVAPVDGVGPSGAAPPTPLAALARPLIAEVAKECGISIDEARRLVFAFGRVAQRMIVAGKAVGVPHVGVLFIENFVKRMRMHTSILRTAKLCGDAEQARQMAETKARGALHYVITKRLAVRAPSKLRTYYQYYGVAYDSWHEYYRRERARILKEYAYIKIPWREARQVSYDVVVTRKEKRMSQHTESQQTGHEPSVQNERPRRRYLVEDRNAAVRENAEGEQRIVKVASREEEAARRGIDEAQI